MMTYETPRLVGFCRRSSDDAWLNANTHTAEMFTAIADRMESLEQANAMLLLQRDSAREMCDRYCALAAETLEGGDGRVGERTKKGY